MGRQINITTKGLKELQKQMKAGETCLQPSDLNPHLADALTIIKDEAYRILKSVTSSATKLPPGFEHIEDALVVQQGKSTTVARAFAKVFRRKAPQAIWIEFGHKIVGHKPQKTDLGKVVPSHPFFRPAIITKRTEARRLVRVRLQQLLLLAFKFGKPGDASD